MKQSKNQATQAFDSVYPTTAPHPDPASTFSLHSQTDASFFPSLNDIGLGSGEPSTTLSALDKDQSLKEDWDKGPSAPLQEMLVYFPDLPTFIVHSKFTVFSNLWIDFQKQILLAKDPENRYGVQNWLKDSFDHIGQIMILIVKSSVNPDSDLEFVSRSMFSAFRQLRDNIDMVHDLFQIIENGRVWFNENPLQAIAPLIENLVRQRQNKGYNKKIQSLYANSRSFLESNQTSVKILQSTVHTSDSDPGYSHTLESTADVPSQGELTSSESCSMPFAEKNAFFAPVPTSQPSNRRLQTQGSSFVAITPCVPSNRPGPSFLASAQNMNLAAREDKDPGPMDTSTARKKQKRLSKQEPKQKYIRSSSRRTATSYDEQTTHFLKSIFYEIYSTHSRLTKEQRKQIEKQTGLKPRNITYWFSNHKRRFQHALGEFKKTIEESQGRVKNYSDFLNWQKKKKLEK